MIPWFRSFCSLGTGLVSHSVQEWNTQSIRNESLSETPIPFSKSTFDALKDQHWLTDAWVPMWHNDAGGSGFLFQDGAARTHSLFYQAISVNAWQDSSCKPQMTAVPFVPWLLQVFSTVQGESLSQTTTSSSTRCCQTRNFTCLTSSTMDIPEWIFVCYRYSSSNGMLLIRRSN